MDTSQISHVLRADPFSKTHFQGVFSSDQLQYFNPELPCAVVVNADPSNRPGSHWMAIYIAETGLGTYFDSYGLSPSIFPDVNTFLKKECDSYRYNNRRIQGFNSTVCGQYAIFFLLHKCRGMDMGKVLSWFTDHHDTNDALVHGFIERHFPCIDEPIYDATMMQQRSMPRTV